MVLISFASAGLVGFLSNSVTGSVEVLGPVFYAVSGADPDGDPGSLLINEFTGNGATYTLSGGNTRYFKTDALEAMGFYAPELNLSVKAYLGEGTEPNSLKLEFGYYDTFVQGTESPFCSVVVNVNSINEEVYSAVCDGVSTDKLEAFYYSIHNQGTSDVQIKVKTYYGETKAEIIGVAD